MDMRSRNGRQPAAPSAVAAPYRRRAATLRDGRRVTLRAVRPDDGGEVVQAFERLSSESRYLRFMQHKKELDPLVLQRGLNPVEGREFALVATVPAADGIDIVGGARYVASTAPDCCEFSITVAEDWRGSGLATRLMRSLMRYAKRNGYRVIEGLVLSDNEPMLALARRLKFSVAPWEQDATVTIVRRTL
jgi:RimJ/RimL family protein N-acetyltransferase